MATDWNATLRWLAQPSEDTEGVSQAIRQAHALAAANPPQVHRGPAVANWNVLLRWLNNPGDSPEVEQAARQAHAMVPANSEAAVRGQVPAGGLQGLFPPPQPIRPPRLNLGGGLLEYSPNQQG